jgi:uncharacterized protein (TIGR03086 family)
MPARRGSQQLLGCAARYALGCVELATPRLLDRRTLCPGWNLQTLLEHLSGSLALLQRGLTVGRVTDGPTPSRLALEADPVERLREQIPGLPSVCAAADGHCPVTIAGGELTGRTVALITALELTVHGWDISIACGTPRTIPPALAAILLSIAPLLLPPGSRTGLFADPMQLANSASPSDQLVAFLGRHPAPVAPVCG